MKLNSSSPITGLVNSKSSIGIETEEIFIGRNKTLLIEVYAEIYNKLDLNSTYELETYELVLRIDDKIIKRETFQVDLAQYSINTLEHEIQLTNTQTENHLVKVELTNVKNKLIQANDITEMLTLAPIKDNTYSIDFNYYKSGRMYYFSYNKYPKDARVFLKINNENWKEIFDHFSMHENDLEGKINYLQLYILDNENQKVYSNVIRIVKDE